MGLAWLGWLGRECGLLHETQRLHPSIPVLRSCSPTPVTAESCGTMHGGQRPLLLLSLLAVYLGVDTGGLGPGEARSRGPRPQGMEGLGGYWSLSATPGSLLPHVTPSRGLPLILPQSPCTQAQRCLSQEPRAGARRNVCSET